MSAGLAKTQQPTATTSHRAEVLALLSMATRGACDLIVVALYGETICQLSPGGDSPEVIRDLVLDQIMHDAQTRDGSRHPYTIQALHGERVLYTAQVRVRGGEREGFTTSGPNVEPNATGALKLLSKSFDQLANLHVRSHVALQSSMHTEIVRQTTRIEKLEADNDRLRAELRSLRDANREQDLRAETERERQRMINHLGAQLLKLLPIVMHRWFGDAAAAPNGKQTAVSKLVPASVLRAFTSLTDSQIAEVRPTLTREQLHVLELAREGRDVTVESIGVFRGLSSEATEAILRTLRADQIDAFSSFVASLESASAAADAPPANAAPTTPAEVIAVAVPVDALEIDALDV